MTSPHSPRVRSYPPDPEVTALQDEAKWLVNEYGPNPDQPTLAKCTAKLRKLAGSDAELLTAATPPLGEGEAELPAWAALLNLARLEAAKVDPTQMRLDALEASVTGLRLDLAQLFERANELVEAKRRSQS